ncbi:MAG: IS4 family transposase [Opitutaceae bacterium]|nr:IS4 family transposase [Opitutaceae bacterium]
MNAGRLVFSQVVELVHREQFDRCASRYPMPRSSRTFSARDQWLCMVFAQLTYREGLRDIEACLASQSRLLYAMGIRGRVTRTNLAYANEHRNWRVFFDLAGILMGKARQLYAQDRQFEPLNQIVYALDASIIDLSLTLFPWARYQRAQAAIKVHTMIDVQAAIPSFVAVTEGKVHDVNALDWIVLEAGAFYIIDRGYLDFFRLARVDQAQAFFVIRAKSNLRYYVRSSREVDKTTGVRSDQTIRLSGTKTRNHYPTDLRRVSFKDPETGKLLVFLTNNFEISALMVAVLYKSRWQIELFFKWIKQNLRIKAFYGTSENAVKTQIWIAVSAYLLVAILNKQLKITQSMARVLQVLSVNVFSKAPIHQLFAEIATSETESDIVNQLMFNGF